jgi:uncharacterized Zn finger protein
MADRETFLKRCAKSWLSEKLRVTFDQADFDSLLNEALELIKKRRVLDFSVNKGICTARIYGDVGAPKIVSIKLPVLSDKEWNLAFAKMAREAFYSASILSEKLPEEVAGLFETNQLAFVPAVSELQFEIEGEKLAKADSRIASIMYRVCERVADDPFLYLLFRGKSREEVIVELRRQRLKIAEEERLASRAKHEHLEEEQNSSLFPVDNSFWRLSDREEFEALSYNIKADELPAAILKWLDALPLSGVEEEVEPLLEEAYEHVTNRAQGYGLGLS